ncbi:MAG: hypothetical protein ABIJ45_12450 [Candidatus Zixiibacteriota bacterium]
MTDQKPGPFEMCAAFAPSGNCRSIINRHSAVGYIALVNNTLFPNFKEEINV